MHDNPSFSTATEVQRAIRGEITTKQMKRTQQDMKEHFLCPDCEQVFAKWERDFSQNIFEKLFQVEYPSELLITTGVRRCVLSILWRVLVAHVLEKQSPSSEFDKSDYSYLRDISEKWKNLLVRGDDERISHLCMHVVPVDWVADQLVARWREEPNFSAYSISSSSFGYQSVYYVFCLTEKIFLFACEPGVFTMPKSCILFGDRIINDGRVHLPKPILDIMADYFSRLDAVTAIREAEEKNSFLDE